MILNLIRTITGEPELNWAEIILGIALALSFWFALVVFLSM
jgi:hypothetical protein